MSIKKICRFPQYLVLILEDFFFPIGKFVHSSVISENYGAKKNVLDRVCNFSPIFYLMKHGALILPYKIECILENNCKSQSLPIFISRSDFCQLPSPRGNDDKDNA